MALKGKQICVPQQNFNSKAVIFWNPVYLYDASVEMTEQLYPPIQTKFSTSSKTANTD